MKALPSFSKVLTLFPILLVLSGSFYFKQRASEECSSLPMQEIAATDREFSYSFKPDRSGYVLLGNLFTQHKVQSEESVTIDPIVLNRSRQTDTWPHYHVYQVHEASSYQLFIQRPRKIAQRPFSGLSPRICSSYESTSLPLIMPSATSVANLLSLGIAAVFLALIFIAGARKSSLNNKVFEFAYFGVLVVASLKASHNYDSIIFKSDVAQKFLSAVVGILLLYPLVQIRRLKESKALIGLVGLHLLLVLFILPGSQMRLGDVSAYVAFASVFPVLLGVIHLFEKKILQGFLLIIFPLDSLGSFGLQPQDFPITSVWFLSASAYFSYQLWESGAKAAFVLLSRQIIRAKQFSKRKNLFGFITEKSSDLFSGSNNHDLKELVDLVSDSFSAKKVSITLKTSSNGSGTHFGYLCEDPDRDAIGTVLNRVLFFGDEFILEDIRESKIAQDGRFKRRKKYGDSYFFSCIPLVGPTGVIGAISMTEFDDEDLFKKGLYRAETTGAIQSLSNQIYIALTESSVKKTESVSALTEDMKRLLFSFTHRAMGSDSVIQSFLESVFERYGLQSVLFKDNERGIGEPKIAILDKRLDETGVGNTPVKLDYLGKNQTGPTVVALLEGKHSYIPNVSELSAILHPKTVRILSDAGVDALASYSLKPRFSRMAIAVFMDQRVPLALREILHSALLTVLPIFEGLLELAEYEEKSQALEVVAHRFVNDDSLRDKLLRESKLGNLASTIGQNEWGLLINLDLISSSGVSEDSLERAKSMGSFFDTAFAELKKSFPESHVCKSTGDGIILRVPRVIRSTGDLDAVFHYLRRVRRSVLEMRMGDLRACIHHGEYFVGIVGTSSFGQVDVIGHNVDRVFRMEQVLKTVPDLKSSPVAVFSDASIDFFQALIHLDHVQYSQWSKKAGLVHIFRLDDQDGEDVLAA